MERLPAVVKSRAMGGGAGRPSRRCSAARSALADDALRRAARPARRHREPPATRCATASSAARRSPHATPSIWPVAGLALVGYGNRRDPFTGGSDFHPGLDISADHGEPVLATGRRHRRDGQLERQLRQPRSSLDHGFGIVTQVRPPVALRRDERPAGQARRRHRLRRLHRPLDERAPALRNLDERPADNPMPLLGCSAALNRALAAGQRCSPGPAPPQAVGGVHGTDQSTCPTRSRATSRVPSAYNQRIP